LIAEAERVVAQFEGLCLFFSEVSSRNPAQFSG
jgi:hypothetical protein